MTSSDLYPQIISRDELASKLNPHLLELVTLPPECRLRRVVATDLLSVRRLDVIAKYIYAKYYIQGVKKGWPLRLYKEHLWTFNRFKENDYSGKSSFHQFVESFSAVIDSVRKDGFSSSRSIIPVTLNGQFVDGSHRIAACLALNKEVTIAEIDFDPISYDARYLQGTGLSVKYIESMVFEFVRLNQNAKAAVLFPIAPDRYTNILELIENTSDFLYAKRISLTESGKINFIKTIYSEENWIRDATKDSAALLASVSARFGRHSHAILIFFVEKQLNVVRHCKETVRSWFELGNLPIHISDYHSETLRLAEISLNENGLEWLNYSRGKSFGNFDALLGEFRDQLKIEMPSGVLLDGSSSLAAFGLRDVSDIDYLCLDNSLELKEADNHDSELIYHIASKEELVTNPKHYFWFERIKIISIQSLRSMKTKRGEGKDKADVLLIESLFQVKGKLSLLTSRLYYKILFFMAISRSRFRSSLSRILPGGVKKIIIWLIEIPQNFTDNIGPIDRCIRYKGFHLHYPRGASLIRRIKRGQYYEPKVASALVNHLSIHERGYFLDVGANIGLMTLNVLSKLPATKVVAFEPGPAQYKYLNRTISSNNLEPQVLVETLALSKESGTTSFSTHGDRHSSGDGFCDTGRAGSGKEIKVNTITLDEWWEKSGFLPVSVIKIDTEGAELWVLQGGKKLLEHSRPFIVLEIEEANMKVYPHTIADILNFFTSINYRLETLAGNAVKQDNFNDLVKSDDTFVAHPV